MSGEIGWDYGRNLPPDRWNELPGFAGGKLPSPIPLARKSATENTGLGKIEPQYPDDAAVVAAMKGFFFENLHFEIEIDPAGNAGGVKIGGVFHKLLKLHFHILAEHTIDGAPLSKMEVHLVHASADSSSLATVVGIMVEELTPELVAQGKTASPILRFFRDLLPSVTLPHTESLARAASPGSLNAGFPAKCSYFRYTGGLTTPPCTEPVLFHILDTTVYTTKEIIEKFSGYVPGGNNRPLQPVNGRLVEYFPG